MSATEGSTELKIYQPPAALAGSAHVSGMAAYEALCKQAETDYEGFWAGHARELLSWKTPFTKVLNESEAPFFKWFEDGTLNASYNCLDRNIERGLGDKTAIIFEADGGEVTKVSYKELLAKTCQIANGLKSLGIKKGDRVVIYIAMSIDGVAAMQACARIGATHSVVFGGFSAQSLRDRIEDTGAVAVIAADEQLRGGGDHRHGAGILDAVAQRLRREAAEHHRVRRADARAGLHCHHAFDRHRHVDDDAVALLHTARLQRVRQLRHLGE
jgi:acetyl-CoA synthetase